MNFARLCAIALALFITTNASAVPMTFSYEFGTGLILTGEIDGTIQLDGDTVHIDSFGPVTYDGNPYDSIDSSEFVSVSDFSDGNLPPLVSFSGALMDVLVCTMGFENGNCDGAETGAFYMHNGVNSDFSFDDAVAIGSLGSAFDSSFITDRWSLTVDSVVSVSEPSSLLLAMIGLLGLVSVRKARR